MGRIEMIALRREGKDPREGWKKIEGGEPQSDSVNRLGKGEKGPPID